MRVLVAYATRHGATAGIAGRVAAALTAAGLPAEARPVEDVTDVDRSGRRAPLCTSRFAAVSAPTTRPTSGRCRASSGR